MALDNRDAWTTGAAKIETNHHAETASPADALLPQTLSGIFDEAFDLYKRHFLTLALILGLIYIPTLIVMQALSRLWLLPLQEAIAASPADMPDLGNAMAYMFGALFLGDPDAAMPGLLTMIALFIASAPLTVAVSEIYLGRHPTVRSAYRGARGFLLRTLGGWILVSLIFVGIAFLSAFVILMIVGLIMAPAGKNLPEEIAVILGVVVMVLPYVIGCAFIAKSYIFTTQLIVLERLSVSSIPTRNGQLVGKKRFRRTFGAVFFLPILTFGLHLCILWSVLSTLKLMPLLPLAQFIVHTACSAIISFLFLPYWIIFLTLLYFDYRVRREGLDVRILSESLPQTEPMTPPTPSSSVPFAAPPSPYSNAPYPYQYPSPAPQPYAQQPYPTQQPYPNQAPYPAQPTAYTEPNRTPPPIVPPLPSGNAALSSQPPIEPTTSAPVESPPPPPQAETAADSEAVPE